MDRRGRIGGMLPLLAIQVANEFYRSGAFPPVTAGLLLSNTLIYLRPGPLHRLLPTLNQVAFNPHLIVKYGSMKRFFLSALYHMNEPHLVYNMMSLLWKGVQLENSMGSPEFASMVAALLVLSQGITLAMAKSLLVVFDYETAYYHEYAVGFSGVLFALKVVLNARSNDYASVHGLVVPARYAAWAELVLIQLVVPGVSFLGHLGGILAGLLYLQLRATFSGPDPLTRLIGPDPLARLIGTVGRAMSWPMRLVGGWVGPRDHGRGRVGRSRPMWRCSRCTFDNNDWIGECEMCGAELEEHRFSSNRAEDELDLDEVRRRRVERFGR